MALGGRRTVVLGILLSTVFLSSLLPRSLNSHSVFLLYAILTIPILLILLKYSSWKQLNIMALCRKPKCDIIGELKRKDLNDVADNILFCLDLVDLKNASLVSKLWREAALKSLHQISSNGSPKWSDDYLARWKTAKSYVENDFQVPADDPMYGQRVANSAQLVMEQQAFKKEFKPEITVDYLEEYNSSGGPVIHRECHFEMNEKFIVAWEPKTKLLKYWSRRTLLPLEMDEEFQMRKYHFEPGSVGMNFQLSGNFLVFVEIRAAKNALDAIFFTKVDLNAESKGIRDTEITNDFPLKPAYVKRENRGFFIRHLRFVDDFLLLVFMHIKDRLKKFFVIVLRKVELMDPFTDLKPFFVEMPSLMNLRLQLNIFFDKDYLVFPWSCNKSTRCWEFRTYSLRPSQKPGPVKLHEIATFQVGDAREIHYRNGLMVVGSTNGRIAFVDVTTGAVRRVINGKQHCDFERGSLLRLTDRYLVNSSYPIPLLFRGTNFYIWDLETILNSASGPFRATPSNEPEYIFKTLTGNLEDFKVDELGIVAAMGKDSAQGIEVVSFMPNCGHCKRLTKPHLLKYCGKCKSAAYCSKECQKADWDPHHKAICTKVDQLYVIRDEEDRTPKVELYTMKKDGTDLKHHGRYEFQ